MKLDSDILLPLTIAALIALVLAALVTYFLDRLRREYNISRILRMRKKADKNIQLYEVLVNYSGNFFQNHKEEIEQKLLAAGFYEPSLVKLYMPLKYFLMIAVTAGVFLFGNIIGIESTTNKLIVSLILLVTVIVGPDAFLRSRKKNLSEKVSSQLPYLLDLMAVCVQTGMTIEAAMQYLTKEMASFDKDIAYMLKKTNDRARVIGLDKSLNELLGRVPTNEMRSFVNTLIQSLQHGTGIYDVLITLAKDIREIQILTLEEKVGGLSAKMSIPLIVFIMMPIVILIVAPGIMRILDGGFG
ncbi:type II secretion system F family protein [Parasalinivibrio latis]|uniref:type II secretion system F family protein n=1 Tax=Parasalinivibrio latis TaxID=2952610 RepID=UPI0030DF4575